MRTTVLALCASLLLGGCVTSRTWEQPTPEQLQYRVEPGDRATIVSTEGKTYSLKVTSVTADAIYGTGATKRYKIAHSMVQSIHVERGHNWPVFVWIGGALLVGGVAAALENFGDQNWDFCGGN